MLEGGGVVEVADWRDCDWSRRRIGKRIAAGIGTSPTPIAAFALRQSFATPRSKDGEQGTGNRERGTGNEERGRRRFGVSAREASWGIAGESRERPFRGAAERGVVWAAAHISPPIHNDSQLPPRFD